MRKSTILNKPWFSVIFIFFIVTAAGCKKDQNPVSLDVTDYSKPEHWLSLPANPDKPVDIFYL